MASVRAFTTVPARIIIVILAAACLLPVRSVYAAPAPGAYASIDEHALNAPASAEVSVESLVEYLTSDAKTDLEKARAIFRWITANLHYDLTSVNWEDPRDVDARLILQQRKTVCTGFSETFCILGRAAGLEVERVAGLAKGCTFTGDSLCSSPPNHEWNAVKIDGKWMLLDLTWATGCMDSDLRFARRYEDFYFCTPPEQFIFDHFPVDPDWQLLPKPISCREYEQLVALKPAFFKYGLELDSHHQFDIKTTGPVEISLIARQDVVVLARLTCGKEQVPSSYTLVEKDGDRLKVAAAFPHPGSYILHLYAKLGNAVGNCKWVADYNIEVTSLSKPCPCFPESLTAFMEHDARLISPRIGRLEEGTSQQFSLSVPGAKVVAVIAGKKWSYLNREGDLFEGTVEVTDEPMQVCVNFGNSREYQVLLTYNKSATP